MKKVTKNKNGFTLVEMVLVIAIIIILAAVILISVSGIIASAKRASDDLTTHLDNSRTVIGEINGQI